MPEASYESHLQEVLAKGMAAEEEVAEARRLLADAAARGADLSVAEALVRAGAKAAHAHHAAAAPAADAATAAVEDTAAAAMPSSDLQVLEKLGRGSQAVVFKCRQISMDRIVAAKILLARSARDADARERFIREARQAANLAHPNIVTIHQIMPFKARSSSGDETLDSYCIVMEYIDGGTVAELLAARKRFDPAEAACIIRPVAEALAFAHKRGIIHRDIKPGNILLTEGGLVKLADLGLAMAISTDAIEPVAGATGGVRTSPDAPASGSGVAGSSVPGRTYGTPYYIAPEQVRGDADVDFRADLYSLAATFYEMVAGVPPFTAPTPQEVMRKHLTDPLPDPRKHVPELPNALCWMLTRAMAKDREYRYESAEEFIAALDKLFPTVDATVAGASSPGRAAGGAGKGRKVVLPDDDSSIVAAPVADPTVPAAQALAEQLAGAAEADRRRSSRAKMVPEAAARPVASARAGAKPGRPAVEAARDPKQIRKRNLIMVVAFGAAVLVLVLLAVLLPRLLPPKPESKPRAAAIYAKQPELPPPAVAPASESPAPPAPVAPSPPAPSHEPVAGATSGVRASPDAPASGSSAPVPPKEPPPPEPQVAKAPEPPPLPPPPPPPPEPPKVEKPAEPAAADPGVIALKAADAKVHGPRGDKGIRYEKVGEPGALEYRDNIGFWGGKDEYVTWDVAIPQPGTYEIEITYAAANGTGGEYTVEVAGKKLKAKTESTGGWHDFKPHTLTGTVKIAKAGPVTIAVRPTAPPKGGGLMNLQTLTLRRTGR